MTDTGFRVLLQPAIVQTALRGSQDNFGFVKPSTGLAISPRLRLRSACFHILETRAAMSPK